MGRPFLDPNEEHEELVLRVHFYGIRSSGGLCMAAVKQLIEMARKEGFHKVAQVLESAYVDTTPKIFHGEKKKGRFTPDTVFFTDEVTIENINKFYEDKIITHELILSKTAAL